MPSDRLERIRRRLLGAIDRLIEIADAHGGLLPSIIDPQTGEIPKNPPPAIPGQREGDRARWGCNLMHDHPLLLAIESIGVAEPRAANVDFVRRYLHRFATRCTQTPSGLFPWGEHAYWRLDRDEIGNSMVEAGGNPAYPLIHDHLRAAPPWLWQRLHDESPSCVQRFAHGLDYHFKHGQPDEYSRHACIDAGAIHLAETAGYEQSGRPKRLTGPRDGANDFPRHSGFYLVDLAFAWTRSGDESLRNLFLRYLDYWWEKRTHEEALPTQSRGPDRQRLAIQTLSLAFSLFEAAEIIASSQRPDFPLIETIRSRARQFVMQCLDPSASDDLPRVLDGRSRAWGSTYGHGVPVTCRYPLLLSGLYRFLRDERLLHMAETLSEQLAETRLPTDMTVPAFDVGLALGAMADLHDLTRQPAWLDRALALAEQSLAIYFTYQFPVGASYIGWYEAQLGTSYLIHGLAQLCYGLPADRSNR